MKGIKDYYNKTAKQWADTFYSNDIAEPMLKKLLEHLPENPRVLDLCCGAGYDTQRIKKLGADPIGIDFSEESIRIAREKNPDIKFYVDDMLNDYSYIGKVDGASIFQ